jgi:Putative beta-barrel porin-2, OmpL-like. bbp2
MRAGIVVLALAMPQLTSGQSGAVTTAAPDAPDKSSWQYGAFVDLAYLHDFNEPDNRLFRSRGTAWHVDDLHLNMAGVYAKKKASRQSRLGSEVLIHGGKDDEVFGFSATAPNVRGAGVLKHVGLANVSYVVPAGDGLTLQGGIFGSLIGYDSLYARDNLNYTRPWGADFTPYLMLGVNGSYPFTDKLTATFAVVNGYWHLADANNIPSAVVQVAYTPTRITLKQTVLVGPHQSNTSPEFWRFLSDTIIERRTRSVIGALETNFSTEQVDAPAPFRAWWMSVQFPVSWDVRGPWRVAVRPELAWDSHGRWTLAQQTIKAVTTTLEYRVPYRRWPQLLRLEHRFDDSRGPGGGFFARGEAAPGVPRLTPSQHLMVFAALFGFDSPSR